MNRKTLTLIIALTCAVVLALGCFAVQALTAGDKQKTLNIDKNTRHITLAYFDQKSTVDYIGAVQGIPVCFDAKECAVDRFALQNIHEHQVKFMENFATDAQKQKLDEIQVRDTDSLGCFMVCVKDVMLVMGDLPEDTPYLTLEQVQAICNEVAQMGFRPVDFDDTEREVMTRFNAITGAPDYQGGSGITNTVYYLNAEHTEYVRVWRGTVRHYDSAGSETWLLRP